jgi:DNA-binding NarL/FixJ family response regulator
LKGARQAETLRAIRAVGNGEAIFGPGIASRVMSYFLLDAERLVLSLKTVRNHVSNICGKLQVADRAQAVIRAREAGLR